MTRPMLPASLLAVPHFIGYRLVERIEGGQKKITKLPMDAHAGGPASSTDPDTWADYDTACRAVEAKGWAGLGFVFAEDDPFTGMDLDHSVEGGRLLPWAQEIVDRFPTYWEMSPSGTGVHGWLIATLPPGRRRTGQIEMYDRGRFFTLTGKKLPEAAEEIADCQAQIETLHRELFPPAPSVVRPTSLSTLALSDRDLLEKARSAKNGAKFITLYDRGDCTAYPSRSEADMALASDLAFWCGPDAAWIDRLFRQSALMREKWEERRGAMTYGERTIEAALTGKTEFYTPPTLAKVTISPSKNGNGKIDSDAQAAPPNLLPEKKWRWTVEEFLGEDFPEPMWIVPDILPMGYTLLAGKQKAGKSLLALQIAHAVATGGRVLNAKCEPGRVLYIYLEGSNIGLQDRLKKQHWPKDANAMIYRRWYNLKTEDGLTRFREELDEGSYRLVIIDTLSRFLGMSGDQNDVGDMTYYLGEIAQAGTETGAGILMIDHHKKGVREASEMGSLDDVLGSTGKTAVADCILGFYRRPAQSSLLTIIGREIEAKTLAVKFDPFSMSWELDADEWGIKPDSRMAKIIAIVRKLGEASLTTITQAIYPDSWQANRGSIANDITELLNKGILLRCDKRGREVPYRLSAFYPDVSLQTHERNMRNIANIDGIEPSDDEDISHVSHVSLSRSESIEEGVIE